MMYPFITASLFILLSASSGFAQVTSALQGAAVGTNYYTQENANRTAAEWEPAKGTMVTWPLCLPYKLVVELAKDNHLYTLVANDSVKNEAMQWYLKWGIDAADNTFISVPQGIDAWWTRDWGPSAVFTPEGTMKLGDGKYVFATPESGLACDDSLSFIYQDKDHNIIRTDIDDQATVPVGRGLDMPVLDLPFITTGGNVMTDGLGTAFSSCILLNENKFFQVSEDQFFSLNASLLGFKPYHILSNFEKEGIQHIDCLMKLLDEERILVAEPPKDHELYPIYENIVENELKKLTTFYGRPYQILRIKVGRYGKERLAAYTNSIIVNKTIYVPLFQIAEDSLALQTWQSAMPGYTIKGFTFALSDEPIVSKEMAAHYRSGYGWNNGDALHCRTRAVWDPGMLFISVKRLPSMVAANAPLTVYASIIDYSKKGLVPNSLTLHWRIKGAQNWQRLSLKPAYGEAHYFGTIPIKASGQTIEYYISAASKSGSRETMPRTAPRGFYTVSTAAPLTMTQSDGGKWVIKDAQNNTLYEVFLYDNGPDYPSEGLIRVVKNGKIGYADANTYAIVIEPQFDCAFPFVNGKAKVSNACQTIKDGEHSMWKSDNWKYVDKTGAF